MTLDSGDYLLLTALIKFPARTDRLPLDDLVQATGLSRSTVKRRLKVLRLHKLISYEKKGGRHLAFDISQDAHIALNNMGKPYAAS